MTGSDLVEESRWWDATEVADAVARGDVTPLEMVDAAIARIEAGDDALNAVVLRWFDHAREVAAGSPAEGRFRGVPFLLKDLWVAYAGQTRTDGNVALAAEPTLATEDSLLVTRTKDAGLITVGRSASPEMGTIPVTETTAHGPTRNPWNPDCTPGGSSGGASAAVAAGMVSVAHASDGGGSIRIPASCSGLVGLKTSQGRISMQGHGNESGLGVDFCVTRTVRDTALLLDALHGPGVGDSVVAPPPLRPYEAELTETPPKLRIGLLDSLPLGGDLHPECVEAVRNTATALEGLGHTVERSHPATMDDGSFTPRFMALWATSRRTGMAAMERTLGRPLTEAEVEPHNWAQAQFAESMTAWQYSEALTAVSEYRRSIQQWWADGWDLLLTPTLASPPLRIGELAPDPERPMEIMKKAGDWVAFTAQFNTSGQPAISLPLHWSADGLPVGVQLVAAYGREDLLIQAAAQLELAMPWADRRPPT